MTQPPPHPGGPGEFYRDPDETEWREVTTAPTAPTAPQPDTTAPTAPTEDTIDGLPKPDTADQGRGHKRHA
jgi:LPS sulfotransferase NodH